MANFGYSKEELDELSSFGETPEERATIVYDKEINSLASLIDAMSVALLRKMTELILKNNERITKQLNEIGIQLPD